MAKRPAPPRPPAKPLPGGTAGLPLPTDNWRSRWLVRRDWRMLHRIARIRWDGDPGEKISGRGAAVCGLRDGFTMPGIFSRMGLRRCPICCKRLGIPVGDGAPYNSLKGRRQHV